MSARPRILCISLSPVARDSRVMRQIGVLAEFGDVTTIGFEGPPVGATEHIEVPAELKTLPQTIGGVINLALRRLTASELTAPAIAWSLSALDGRSFDLIVVNEARALALGHAVSAGAPVWADMHEWSPEERTHILSWRLLVAPLMVHLCTKYLPVSAAVTTVCHSIADLYDTHFGLSTRVMRNSGPHRALTPSPLVGETIRLVHSGVAVQGRQIEIMIDVVMGLDSRYTLDFYLMASGDGGRYLEALKQRARGCDRITFHAAVPPLELPDTLNSYDVGVFWIPPTHTNARFALPNKFFDFVQARLAIAVGPSVEMARLVDQFELGAVSSGFAVAECSESIRALSQADIMRAKNASDAAAAELSFDTDAEVARGILRELLGAREG